MNHKTLFHYDALDKSFQVFFIKQDLPIIIKKEDK